MINCSAELVEEPFMLQKTTATAEAPEIPRELLAQSLAYESSRMRKRPGTRWPPYLEMRASLLDTAKTLKSIGAQIDVTLECVRQVCERYFPDARPNGKRYGYGRTKVVRPPKESRASWYRVLKKRAAKRGLTVQPLYDERGHLVLHGCLLEGRRTFVAHIRTAYQHPGCDRYWAKTPIVSRENMARFELLVVLVDVRKDIAWAETYAARMEEFLSSNVVYVHVGHGKNRIENRQAKFDWRCRKGFTHLKLR